MSIAGRVVGVAFKTAQHRPLPFQLGRQVHPYVKQLLKHLVAYTEDVEMKALDWNAGKSLLLWGSGRRKGFGRAGCLHEWATQEIGSGQD